LALPFCFVFDLNQEAFRELFAVRLMLEVGAVELAAPLITDEQLARLDALRARARASVGDVEAFVDDDIAFHDIIHEASQNAILLAVMQSLSTLGRQSRMLTARRRSVREQVVHEHDQIYEALKAHDPAQAAAAMRAHLAHTAPHLDPEPR
jgi:DNA-binding FadR family transcriptional regulator